MKELKLVFIMLLLFLSSCKNDKKENSTIDIKEYVELPADKYDAVQLNNQVSSIQKGALVLVDSVFRADTSSISKKLDDAIFDLEVSLSRLESLSKEHEMAAYFSESVSHLLKFYKTEFENNFKSLVPILKKSKLSESDKVSLDLYDREFVDQEAILFKEIVVRQDSFADFFKIRLVN